MNFIEGICHTNLDDYDCSLTKVFAAVPNIGDRVEVLYKGNTSYLKVCAVSHKQRGEFPVLEIELDKTRL